MLFIKPLFSWPCQLSNFFLNCGMISATASYKTPSYEKIECSAFITKKSFDPFSHVKFKSEMIYLGKEITFYKSK